MAVTRPVTNTGFGWKWIHVCQSSRKIPAAQPYHQGRHPCNFEKKTEVLRVRKCASGHPAMSEARVPAGQDRKRRTLRSAQRGTECDLRKSHSFSERSRSSPEGARLQAWSAIADRAGRPKGSGQPSGAFTGIIVTRRQPPFDDPGLPAHRRCSKSTSLVRHSRY